MMILIIGLALWASTHLFVSCCAEQRTALISRLGLYPYKGLFSLTLVLALILIVMGWRSTPAISLWVPPAGMRHLTMLLVPIAVILFFAARMPTDIKQWLRHPQLTGVKLWALAHLLSNGETRSLILFGGLLAWAVLEVIFINRRDGARVKPEPVGIAKTLVQAVIGLLISAALIFAHPWFAGMPVISVSSGS